MREMSPRYSVENVDLSDLADSPEDNVEMLVDHLRKKFLKGRSSDTGIVWYIKDGAIVENFIKYVNLQKDLRKKPVMDFQYGADYGGVFRDLFSQFWSKVMNFHDKDTVGDLFVGNRDGGLLTVTHITQESGSEKPNYFRTSGQLLYLCLVHRGPFPTQLDPSVFRYIFDRKPDATKVHLVDSMAGRFIGEVHESQLQSGFVESVDGLEDWLIDKSELVRFQASKWAKLDKTETIAKIARTALFDSRAGNLNLLKEGFDQHCIIRKFKESAMWNTLEVYLWRVVLTAKEFMDQISGPVVTDTDSKAVSYRHFCRFISGVHELNRADLLQKTMRYCTSYANIPLEKQIQVMFEPSGSRYLPTASTCSPSITLGTSYTDDQEGYVTFVKDIGKAFELGCDLFGFE